jgi:hypothetical protein
MELGFYWVKTTNHPSPDYWEPAFWNGDFWFFWNEDDFTPIGQTPAVIGPKLERPD